MSAESHYTINVAKHNPLFLPDRYKRGPEYQHLFRVDVVSTYPAQLAYNEIKAKFQEPEYKVDVTDWRCTGHKVTDAFEEGRKS